MLPKYLIYAGILLLCLTDRASASEMLHLMLSPNGGTADIVFKSDMRASDAFLVRTEGIAVPGSRVRISIDRDRKALYDKIIDASSCSFAAGPAVCSVPTKGGSPEFDALVIAFKAGLIAHVQIRNAGSEPMRSETSLVGFRGAFSTL